MNAVPNTARDRDLRVAACATSELRLPFHVHVVCARPGTRAAWTRHGPWRGRYSPGRVIGTHGPWAQAQVLSWLLVGQLARLKFISLGRPSGQCTVERSLVLRHVGSSEHG